MISGSLRSSSEPMSSLLRVLVSSAADVVIGSARCESLFVAAAEAKMFRVMFEAGLGLRCVGHLSARDCKPMPWFVLVKIGDLCCAQHDAHQFVGRGEPSIRAAVHLVAATK